MHNPKILLLQLTSATRSRRLEPRLLNLPFTSPFDSRVPCVVLSRVLCVFQIFRNFTATEQRATVKSCDGLHRYIFPTSKLKRSILMTLISCESLNSHTPINPGYEVLGVPETGAQTAEPAFHQVQYLLTCLLSRVIYVFHVFLNSWH